MTLMERDNFRQKMLDEYGPGWESIVKEYKERSTPRFGPHADYRGMSVNPDNFRTDNPLSLLSSREDIELALREPTKQDWINELDRMDPDRLQGPAPSMEVRTHGVPTSSNEIIPYHAESFQNIIRPLPHQLEGPEAVPGPMMVGGPPDMYGRQMSHRDLAYDPNQELYDPNYYGTEGQIGQMGAPPPGIIPSSVTGIIPSSVTGRHISPNAPYSVTGRSAMSGGEMPGLLDSGEQYSGLPKGTPFKGIRDKWNEWRSGPGDQPQTSPGPDPDNRIASQPAGPLTPTNKGPKWELDADGRPSIYGRDRRFEGFKGIMDLGSRITGGPSKWRSR